MIPVIQIGPAALQTSALLMIIGAYLGLSISERFTRKLGKDPDPYTNLLLIAGLAGLLAARATYALAHLQLFRNNPLALVSFDPGLLDAWGGFAGAFISALIYSQRKRLEFWDILDRLTACLATLAVFLGLAHIASGHAFGAPSSVPWAIALWGTRRQPSQFYETFTALVILLLLWKQFRTSNQPGRLFLRFTAAYSFSLVFLTAFRGDSRLVFASFRLEQVIALVILGLALLLLELRRRASPSVEPAPGLE